MYTEDEYCAEIGKDCKSCDYTIDDRCEDVCRTVFDVVVPNLIRSQVRIPHVSTTSVGGTSGDE